MAQMPAIVVNERQDNWDAQLPYRVESAYSNSVSVATGLASNEVYMGRLPRLSRTAIFDRSWVAGHQSLAHDYLAYCDLESERQRRGNDMIREIHA